MFIDINFKRTKSATMVKKQTKNSTPSAVNNDDVVIESFNVTITTAEATVVIPSSEANEAPAATNVLKTRHN